MENNEVVTQEVSQTEQVEVKQEAQTLTTEQEIGALRKVHEFLSAFDRVPGSMSAQWSQMLDTVAVVANSLIAKLPAPQQEDVEAATTSTN